MTTIDAPAARPTRSAARLDPLTAGLLQALAFLSPWLGYSAPGISLTVVDLYAPIAALYLILGYVRAPIFIHLYTGYVLLVLLAVGMVAIYGNGLAPFGASSVTLQVVGALRLLGIFSPFILVFSLRAFDEELARKLLVAGAAGLLIAVAAGFGLYAAGIRVREDQQNMWEFALGRYSRTLRAGGLSGNSTAFGAQIGALFIAYFFAVTLLVKRRPPLLDLAVFGLVVACIFASSSRAGYLQIAACAALAMAAPRLRPSGASIVGMGFALSLIFIFMVFAGYQPSLPDSTFITRLDIFNLTGQTQFYESVRLRLFAAALAVVEDHFLFGVGYKMSMPALSLIVDNAFLNTLLESGALATAAFAGFWLSFLIWSLHAAVARRDAAAMLAFAVAASFVARMMVDATHTIWNSTPVIYLILAVLCRLSLERRGRTPEAA
ncbi:MAG: O-antigen ligase family protein [Pseudomonadota bacterium]